MKKTFIGLTVMLVAFLCALTLGERKGEDGGGYPLPASASAAELRPGADFGRIPLQFIPNQGQAGEGAAFYVQGLDKTVYFSEKGLTFVLGGQGREKWSTKLDFVAPSPEAALVGLEKSGAVVSYFKGKPEEWKVGLPAYSGIAYRDLWPGIDLVYSGTSDRMKYQFVVRPGADPGRIRLVYRGAKAVRVTEEGRLTVETPAGGFQDDVPVAYQEIEGSRVGVPVSYSLARAAGTGKARGASPSDGTEYGFRVGKYDGARTLVLDPAVIVSCGFLGGSGEDAALGMALDASGNVYIAGRTSSGDISFPPAAGPAYGGGASDAFVAKLNPEGTALVYCAYIGGDGEDGAEGIDLDSNGSIYVAGATDSPETTFPVTLGPDLTYNGGESDAFIAKVEASGTVLVWCGYVGGDGTDSADDVDLTEYGSGPPWTQSLFLAGSTSSSEATFPVKPSDPVNPSFPDQTYNGGASDAFVAGIDAAGAGLLNCGYIGGSERDEATGMTQAVWSDWGSATLYIYVAGTTSSTETTFPVSGSPEIADLTYNGGGSDAFVARFSTMSLSLELCGYIGGAGDDAAADLVPRAGAGLFGQGVLITGRTSSTEATFPVIGGPDLTYNGGDSDVFVAALSDSSSPTGLVYCGYIGGAGTDLGTDIFGGPEAFYVTGATSSTESTFPVKVGPDLTYNGGLSDAFVARVEIVTGELSTCGYVGGLGTDRAEAVAGENIVGVTESDQSSFPVAGGPDLTFNGASDAFVATLHLEPPRLNALSPSSALAGSGGFTLSLQGAGFADGAEVKWAGVNRPATFVSGTELTTVIEAADLTTGGYVEVRVENPGEDLSNALTFNIYHPTPSVSSISPTGATGGGGDVDLTVTGSGFESGAVVQVMGTDVSTVFKSASELQAVVPSSLLSQSGEFPVTVTNPAPNMGPSNSLPFRVSGFTMTPEQTSRTVNAGQSAIYSIQIAPQFGAFDAEISLICKSKPHGSTAAFSRTTLIPGSSGTTVTLTLTTSGPSGLALGSSAAVFPLAPGLVLVILIGCAGLFARKTFPRFPRRRWVAAAVLIVVAVLAGGCDIGGTRDPGTRPGTYQIIVQGTSGSMSVSTVVELIVR